jgi:hypothetical protein
MGGTYNTGGGNMNTFKILVGKTQWKRQLWKLGVDGWMILTWFSDNSM